MLRTRDLCSNNNPQLPSLLLVPVRTLLYSDVAVLTPNITWLNSFLATIFILPLFTASCFFFPVSILLVDYAPCQLGSVLSTPLPDFHSLEFDLPQTTYLTVTLRMIFYFSITVTLALHPSKLLGWCLLPPWWN